LKSDLVNSPNYYSIRPVADQGWDLGDDAWEVNGQMVESGQHGEFTITPAIYDAYPDGTTFCYNFFDPSSATVTITVLSGKWQSNKWNNEPGGMVGFTSAPTTVNAQKTVPYGSMVTVYGSGKYGTQNTSYGTVNWLYKVKGFYTPLHYTYKSGNNTDKDSWTFKATSDMTIYVDFEYAENK